MDSCRNCGGTEFHVESGFYYCNQCHMQNEKKMEQDVEFSTDPRTRIMSFTVQKAKDTLEKDDRTLTSWEKYNFVLIGLTNELIQLGAKENLKLIVAQLWSTYLAKLEVAFVSTRRVALPKLSKRYDKKDAQIIYQRAVDSKKKKKLKLAGSITSGSSASTAASVREIAKRKRLLADSDYKSQVSTEAESGLSQGSDSELSEASTASSRGPRLQFNELAREEKKILAEKAKKLPKGKRKKFIATSKSATALYGPDSITPIKLLGVLYLALRLNNDDIHLADILRLTRDGHLSYYKLDHFIPSDCSFTKSEASRLNKYRELNHTGMMRPIERLRKLLQIWKFPQPNLLTLMKKYCTELQLPNGILQYAERILAAWPPKFVFNKKENTFPEYETRAMAIIVVVMKMLFGLDGVTENENSRVIERINEVAEEKRVLDATLFSFCKWQRYIECRRRHLINEHFPTKLRYEPFSIGNSHLYVNFQQSLDDKTEQPWRGDTTHNYTPRVIFDSMVDKIHEITNILLDPKPSKVFTPSLTPQHSYLQQLLEDTKDTERTFPSILLQDFPSTKIGFIKNPESLKELAAQCDIELNVVYHSASYVRRVVQVFEEHSTRVTLMKGTTKIHNNMTRVTAPVNMTLSKKSDDPSDYLHRRRPGKILVETKKQRLFNKMMKLYQEQRLVLEKKLYEEYNQTVQASLSEDDNQTVQDPLSEKNNQSVQEKSPEENSQIVGDKFSEENSQIVGDKFPEENSQMVQDEFCEENSEMIEDELYEENNQTNQDSDYFGFGQVLPNGKLKISEDNSDSDDAPEKEDKFDNILLSKFEKQSMVNPVPNPWDVKKRFRNAYFESMIVRPRPHPLVPYSRYYKQKLEALKASESKIQEEPKSTESAVHIVEPDIVMVAFNEDKNKENGVIVENEDVSEVPVVVIDENEEIKVIAEKKGTNKGLVEIIDENEEIKVIAEKKDTNKGLVEIIDENKKNEAITENKDVNPDTVIVIDENEEIEVIAENKDTNKTPVEIIDENKENKTTFETEMEIDFEAVEHKIEIKPEEIPNIDISESKSMEVSDNADEITINDESANETVDEDPAPDQEVIINDECSDEEISILTERIDSLPSANQKDSLPEKELLTLFIPYKEYWLYRASGSSTLSSNHFRFLQREFPANFRWLLHECANIIESSPQELYREVCLVEGYYTDVLAPDEHMEKCEEYDTKFFRTKNNKTHVKKIWNT